jgi:rRNA maturation endonuclease Nob1
MSHQLRVEAINPVLDESWRSFRWVVRAARWEVTCGFCRTRFKDTGWMLRSSVVCPACGTRNLLPSASNRQRGTTA